MIDNMKAKNRSIKHPSLGEGLGGLPRSSLDKPHYRGWPRDHYNRDHTDKYPFPSLKAARRAARNMMKDTGDQFSAYKCKYCGNYHIGHNEFLPQRERIQLLSDKISLESKILQDLKAEVESIGNQLTALTAKIVDTEYTIRQHCHELADLKTTLINNSQL